MSSSSLLLNFSLSIISIPHTRFHLNPTTSSPFLFPKKHTHRPLVCFSFSSSDNPNYEREEARWLREEQRWLREEQRWLREESRWQAERESLIRQISALEHQIQELEGRQGGASVSEAVAKVSALLQAVKEGDLGKNLNRISESGSGAVPMVVEATAASGDLVVEDKEEEVVVVKEVIQERKREVKEAKRIRTLKMGAEGEDVRILQEALQKLGFYSGEEDIEYSMFSSGTNRAVKTWQASLGAQEDGIMTPELQEKLYVAALAEGGNGSLVTWPVEIGQKPVENVKEVEESRSRVFLLGENRWEDSSRLTDRTKPIAGAESKVSPTTKCITCRGEGRLLCLECDGTGEPNIEEQFMEWVEEGAKCPYCEGLGYTICDVCNGKP